MPDQNEVPVGHPPADSEPEFVCPLDLGNDSGEHMGQKMYDLLDRRLPPNKSEPGAHVPLQTIVDRCQNCALAYTSVDEEARPVDHRQQGGMATTESDCYASDPEAARIAEQQTHAWRSSAIFRAEHPNPIPGERRAHLRAISLLPGSSVPQATRVPNT